MIEMSITNIAYRTTICRLGCRRNIDIVQFVIVWMAQLITVYKQFRFGFEDKTWRFCLSHPSATTDTNTNLYYRNERRWLIVWSVPFVIEYFQQFKCSANSHVLFNPASVHCYLSVRCMKNTEWILAASRHVNDVNFFVFTLPSGEVLFSRIESTSRFISY